MRTKDLLIKNAVPIVFAALSILLVVASQMDPLFLLQEVITRLSRNSFLVLALIIPVIAGLGLNFAIVLGAMSGQAAVIMITHWMTTMPADNTMLAIFRWQGGLGGFLFSAIISAPIALILGWLVGKTLNAAKGREMITALMLGFFANGIYQLIFLIGIGTVIPMTNPRMVLPGGVGLRITVDLFNPVGRPIRSIGGALNNLILPRIGMIRIPVVPLLVVAGLCLFIYFFMRTKLGQQIRATGQDMYVSEVAGIKVNKIRVIAVMFSTVLAAWGQLIWLQDIGTLNTYASHEQVGMFAIAALLVGGASTKRATIWNALIGVVLFHTLFVVSPVAGQRLFGQSQIGEYFRVFIAYGVIGLSLALHAWRTKKL
jgi:simple sugar transport system permease protein